MYDRERPGIGVRHFGLGEAAEQAGLNELRRMEQTAAPRWSVAVLVGFAFFAAFWLVGALFATFYEQPPTLGQPESMITKVARFFENNASEAFQAACLVVGIAVVMYVRTRIRRRT